MGKGFPRSFATAKADQLPTARRTYLARGLLLVNKAVTTFPGFGSAILAPLPVGDILLLGAVGYFEFGEGADTFDLTADYQGDYALGIGETETFTISSDEQNILGSTPLPPAVAKAGPRTRAVGLVTNSGLVLDNSAGLLQMRLNMLIDAEDIADSGTVDLVVNGELLLFFSVLGGSS